MKFNRISAVLLFAGVSFFFVACHHSPAPSRTASWAKLMNRHHLQNYEYLFLIHISPRDCQSCLPNLETLNALQSQIREQGNNTRIAIAGDSSSAFLNIYRSFHLNVAFVNEKELKTLELPLADQTPVCYLYNLKQQQVIYADYLPREEKTFRTLKTLVKRYSGILYSVN